MTQIERLCPDVAQAGRLGPVDGWEGRLWIQELMQAETHPIGAQAAIGQGLGDGLFDILSGVSTMQLQDAKELTNTFPLAMASL
jgi:hypothetical protein